jgi:serine/threonine-protein kinase
VPWKTRLVAAALVLFGMPVLAAARQIGDHDFVPAWRVETTGVVHERPVVVGGLAYFAAQDGTLTAVEMATGSVAWSAPTGDGFPLGPTVADGIVYVANQSGPLHAFDAASGDRIWTAEGVASRGSGRPAAGAGVVFVNRFEGDRAVLAALDAATGRVAWEAPLGMATHGSPVVLADRVFATGSAATDPTPLVLSFDATSGKPGWDSGMPLSVVGAAGDLVYASGSDGLVALASATGDVAWSFRPDPEAGGVWAVDGPTVLDGVLYVGVAIGMGGNPDPPSGGTVYALDAATGQRLWATPVDGGVARGPAVAGDVVAVVAGLGRGLYAFDADTGEVTWYRPQRAGITSALGIADGWLLLADQDGSVAAWVDLER